MAVALLVGGAVAQWSAKYTSRTERDCRKLKDIYETMNGRNWKVNTEGDHSKRWDMLNMKSCCSWAGINCKADEYKWRNEVHVEWRVEMVNLDGFKKVTGTIPDSIVDLDKLERVRMKWTEHLSGTLPKDIGKLTDLEELKIGRNKVSGTLPFSIYALTNLEELYLKSSKISGTLSEAIGAFTELSELNIGEAKFEGTLPSAITGLTKLKDFIIEDNAWRGWLPKLPPAILDCEVSDKHFNDPYENRQNKPLDAGVQGWGEKNANFNCPLPPSLPKSCEATAYCITEPLAFPPYEHADVPWAAAPPSNGFGSGMGAGMAVMLAVCVMSCAGMFVFRKKLIALLVVSKPMISNSSTKSDTETPDVHPAAERAY